MTGLPQGDNDPLWYKDAIIYEVHVRAFFDSNADGRGDFRGLAAKLDYLQDLGVTALWLLPFYPSPWREDGYDVSSYTDIHPAYGSMRHFQLLLAEAHRSHANGCRGRRGASAGTTGADRKYDSELIR